ncbi:MAG: SHOCT domain-containing protein [Bacteroidota bacterium]
MDLKEQCQSLLGNYLKLKRRERDLTQEEVGINVGYSPQTAKQAISQIERGVTWVPSKKLSEFVRFLELDASFFSLLSYYYSIKNYTETHNMLQKLQAHAIRNLSDDMQIPLGQPRSPVPAKASAESDPEEKLERHLAKLKDLFDKGLIDEDDYKEAKRDALKKLLG